MSQDLKKRFFPNLIPIPQRSSARCPDCQIRMESFSCGDTVVNSISLCARCRGQVLEEFTFSYNTHVHLKRCKRCEGTLPGFHA